ncbi:ElyC/SanA/YdcF family protein [Rhizobium calliandrae]|uniref:ElyC/SanA/YdcF family protein n=1 Tax=Rhizobium calliandrae TaxID=1312182 RepID=A0ABT7KJF2_9HYPH|nr:ElyC/SanA/YdcF family protein [Rhizobium calliandrae]MDL2408745.1 ElyC/SanA/YdcF family protein [Rhizobium calliandrae]
MFVFSKLVWIFGQPLSLAFFFGVLALIASLLHKRFIAIVSTFLSVLILFVALYTTTGAYIVQGLEERFPHPTGDPAELKCMIVLGGATQNEVTTARGGYELDSAGDRLIETLRLAQKFPQARVVVSGGDGSISGNYEGDAVISERFFVALGLPKSRLIEDTTSRTTFENAVNTKELLAKNGLSDCLLITSGFHMPRSVGIFRKQGIDIVPWPVDYRSTGKETLGFDFTQPSLNAQLLATGIREWIGLVGYYAAGRTSALYPGP